MFINKWTWIVKYILDLVQARAIDKEWSGGDAVHEVSREFFMWHRLENLLLFDSTLKIRWVYVDFNRSLLM